MSGGPLNSVGRLLFWRYARGSWQYDILCGLILVFIFATPKSVFDGSYFRDQSNGKRVQATAGPEKSPGVARKAPHEKQPTSQ